MPLYLPRMYQSIFESRAPVSNPPLGLFLPASSSTQPATLAGIHFFLSLSLAGFSLRRYIGGHQQQTQQQQQPWQRQQQLETSRIEKKPTEAKERQSITFLNLVYGGRKKLVVFKKKRKKFRLGKLFFFPSLSYPQLTTSKAKGYRKYSESKRK